MTDQDHQDLEVLRQDIAQLRINLTQMASSLRAVSERPPACSPDCAYRTAQAKVSLESIRATIRDEIKAKPLTSAIVAAGFGVLIGLICS